MTHLVLCVVVVSSFSASEGRVYMKCVFVCETLKGISGSGRHVVPPLGPPLNVLLSTIFIKRKQEMHLFIPATILHSSSCYLSTANDIVLNYLACCLYFVLTCIPPNLNSQAPIWATRREAQLVTDPATSAIWYIGGATNGGDTNEVDKFLSDAWNTNVPTVKKDAGSSGTGSPAIMGSYSAGTSHLIDGKIYIFGGFASAASSPRTYQTFQNLPWLDISTTPPTIGTQFTLGAVPPPRQDHCSVLTSSKKIIIYGGYDANSKTTYSDVWALDLVTLTWQQIVTVNSSRPRSGHTCNIVGANMVVFGGRNGTDIGYSRDIQVYDVMLSNWMGSYAPKPDTTPISDPLPGGVNGPGGNHSALTTAALIGIIVGSIALLACFGGVFIYRRRQRKIEIREAEMEKEAYLASLGTDGEDKTGGGGGGGGKGKRGI
ncbi:MAG: hypothetical protein JOS17DRAFT_505392 [Linnemannia elongata]|nr:MAG: hypothetical protein JOS17DRAFT_505392 [Linnemannia elongata]